jgi:hypothetical protein
LVLGALSLGVKRPEREAHHSPPSSAKVKECVQLYLYFPNTPSWRGAQLRIMKHRNNFIFTFYLMTFLYGVVKGELERITEEAVIYEEHVERLYNTIPHYSTVRRIHT